MLAFTLVLNFNGELDEDRFGDWVQSGLAEFEGRLLRIKGILAMAGVDERIVLQGVAARIDVSSGQAWESEPRTSRLVIIGFALDEEKLSRGFEACGEA